MKIKHIVIVSVLLAGAFSCNKQTFESLQGEYVYKQNDGSHSLKLNSEGGFSYHTMVGLIDDTITGIYIIAKNKILLNSFVQRENIPTNYSIIKELKNKPANCNFAFFDKTTADTLYAAVTLLHHNKSKETFQSNFNEDNLELDLSGIDSIQISFIGYFDYLLETKNIIGKYVNIYLYPERFFFIANEKWKSNKSGLENPTGMQFIKKNE